MNRPLVKQTREINKITTASSCCRLGGSCFIAVPEINAVGDVIKMRCKEV